MRISDWSSDVCSSDLVMFPGDIDPWVAAVGSRLEFTANAGIPQNRILGDEVRDNDRDEAAERVLPVTTRWGLALLGLAAGETIAVEDAGTAVRLRLTGVEPLQRPADASRSEEHTSERQSLMPTSYAVFC